MQPRWLPLVFGISVMAGSIQSQVKVLFLTESRGFAHPVVKRAQRAMLAHAERKLMEAARSQFEVVCSQDSREITAESLRNYRAVVFYTTGELPMDEDARAALLDFVRAGGGFVGVHSATDTFYEWPAYGEMIGGYFDGHPWHQKVSVIVEDPNHPAAMHLVPEFRITDEIYQHRSFAKDRVRVLLSLDPDSVEIERGQRADQEYALAWCRDYGAGRVFYTALGHRPEVWADRRFQRHLVAGIRWAMNAEQELGAPPPGAVVLFDGSGLGHWESAKGGSPQWSVEDGVLVARRGNGSIQTRRVWRDFRLHVEFCLPEGKANSGIYLQRRYEVQILDAEHEDGRRRGGCGSIYGRRSPDRFVGREAGQWQSYDITFRAARFADGKKTENARITVIWNGIVVHDAVEVPGKTGAGQAEGPDPMPILLQEHGTSMRFRNVWILPAD